MLGVLVAGDNHFIVCGPRPDRITALALVHHWSVIQIGATTPSDLSAWQIVDKAFREDLEWAVLVEGLGEPSSAVTQLLRELEARSVVLVSTSLAYSERNSVESVTSR